MLFTWEIAICYFFVLQGLQTHALASLQSRNITANHVFFFANNTGQTRQTSTRLQSLSTMKAGLVQETSSTAAHGMGDFIAMGMGMSGTSDLPSGNITDFTTSSEISSSSETLTSHPLHQSSDRSVGAGTKQNVNDTGSSPTTSKDAGALYGTGTPNSSTRPSGYILVRRRLTPGRVDLLVISTRNDLDLHLHRGEIPVYINSTFLL